MHLYVYCKTSWHALFVSVEYVCMCLKLIKVQKKKRNHVSDTFVKVFHFLNILKLLKICLSYLHWFLDKLLH